MGQPETTLDWVYFGLGVALGGLVDAAANLGGSFPCLAQIGALLSVGYTLYIVLRQGITDG